MAKNNSLKSFANQLQPKRSKKQKFSRQGDSGYDNPRENIDPHVKTKILSCQQGTIEKTPTSDKEIANKKYVDDNGGGGGGLWEVDGTETQLIIADEVDMQSKKIINMTDPLQPQDAATKKYTDENQNVDYNGSEWQFIIADTMTMQSKKIINVLDPAANQDAATKKYVDDQDLLIEGTEIKSTGEGGGTKFLREDGDNTCSWQTPSGGAATKEIFIGSMPMENVSATFNRVGAFGVATLSSSAFVNINFKIPHDFSSLVSLTIVMIPDATETIQWDATSNYAAAGEAYTTHGTTLTNQTDAVTENEMTEIDISGAFASIAANDFAAIQFESDTSTMQVIGLRLKYT